MLRIQLASYNYVNLVKIDLRNNKIIMTTDEVFKLAEKMCKFVKLRTFNFERNKSIDLTPDSDAYINLIESLPNSLEMFNN